MSKITVDRALIHQALEVLTDNRSDIARCESAPYMSQYYDKAISDLREALEQPQQEPVAWMDKNGRYEDRSFTFDYEEGWLPLYTSPPARKPMTDEQIEGIASPFIQSVGSHWEHDDAIRDNGDIEDFARAIEAAHGIKDTPC